ncbi:MAG TPA: hypothetical protein VGJ06_03675 [Candidatus Acidoferrum sp.]|jgi:hypothetical protein
MKFLVACAAAALVVFAPAFSPQQKSENKCDFGLSGTHVQPNITGPTEILPIIHVVDQPDSPVEIVSADFKGSFVSVSNEQFTEELNCSIKLRNRSDRVVRSFDTITGVVSGEIGIPTMSGFGAVSGLPNGRSLTPGAELEIKGCGGGGNGSAPGNRVRLIVGIEAVSFDGCIYIPSRRFAL